MSWTQPPKTWTSGATLTAADLNTHLRDQLNWLANDHPRCRAVRTSAQSITTGTNTNVTFTAADSYDVGAMHDPGGGNPERITVPSGGGGIYIVTANVEGANPGAFRWIFLIQLNGTTTIAEQVVEPPSGAAGFSSLAALINLVATDYVTLVVNQNTGGNLGLNSAQLAVNWLAF